MFEVKLEHDLQLAYLLQQIVYSWLFTVAFSLLHLHRMHKKEVIISLPLGDFFFHALLLNFNQYY